MTLSRMALLQHINDSGAAWADMWREQVRLAGNAVTPPAARDLVGLVVETVTGETLQPTA